ncbi:scavenger receptor class F member 1-like isoform X2 [Haliotis rufescens]|uniref:scavenger receptor class F member 1-like isoform X2 n=1 Tax=Haliotis rufescens TaxID=6454 RepID=UPI00201F5EA6|nr:scavenger receptor class F member 1-like isoform X2 [Haliotis rufescens]
MSALAAPPCGEHANLHTAISRRASWRDSPSSFTASLNHMSRTLETENMSPTLVLIICSCVVHAAHAADICSDGKYGPSCLSNCGQNCNESRCLSEPGSGTFRCSTGCIDGWTGQMCHWKCRKGCMSCDQVTGECREDCVENWCGANCDSYCGPGKNDGSAKPGCLDVLCQHCVKGLYGDDCSKACPANCDSGCSKTSGECDHQCIRGYHGPSCSAPCTTTCKEGCNQTDASCLGCQCGWHGRQCHMSCSNTCLNHVCYQDTGECAVAVKYSLTSFQKCKRIKTGSVVIGNCSVGCESGWRGARCDQKCPSECYSCSQFPNAELCTFTIDVTKTRTHGYAPETSDTFKIRILYAFLLVIPPFLVVMVVQMICLTYLKYRIRFCNRKQYEVCETINSEKFV